MKLLMATLLAGVSIYGGAQLADTFVPEASEMTAYHQGRLISDRAYIESEMGARWEEALRVAVEQTRHNDGQLTVTGTMVRWNNGVDTWCINLPDPMAKVEPVRCNP